MDDRTNGTVGFGSGQKTEVEKTAGYRVVLSQRVIIRKQQNLIVLSNSPAEKDKT